MFRALLYAIVVVVTLPGRAGMQRSAGDSSASKFPSINCQFARGGAVQ